MDCFHRFHVMRCDDNQANYVKYPCVRSPSPTKARKSSLKKPCRRCGRVEPGCVRIPDRCPQPQPCNKCNRNPSCIVRHNVCTGKKKKLKNKNINTDCILMSQIPNCKLRRRKRTGFETNGLRSPCSILSFQNKRGQVNPHPSQHVHCRKYYPLHPRTLCDDINQNDCHSHKRDCYRPKPKSCVPCRKAIATNTSAILEPKCVQIKKQMNEFNDATLKCTTVSKGCMCEPGCCNELVCNLNAAPCQRPIYCDDAPCKFDGVAPCDIPNCYNDSPCKDDEVAPCVRPNCFSDPPCKVVEVAPCYKQTCFKDPPCKLDEGPPCYKQTCFKDPPCKVDEYPPCYKQTCFKDPPCRDDEIYPCRFPTCTNDVPCKRNKIPPCHRLKCYNDSPCKIDEYAPCQRPPKKRNKKTNTKAISRCWKLKKLPKIRQCIQKRECCIRGKIKTCDRRNSKVSVCDCLRNLRTRSITCTPGKHTQVSTVIDSCWNNPCGSPNMITKMTCNSESVRNLGLTQTCPPKPMKCLTDCGIKTCDSLLNCHLYNKMKAIQKIKARRRRQKCCRCILTCTFAIFCAPCVLVAFSYWLIKYVCSSCNEDNNCKVKYPCEMQPGDMCYSVTGLDKNCHGKYCIDKYNKICNDKCPILDDETLIINGCEQKCFKKVSCDPPCPYNFDLYRRPCFDGSDERCIQTSRCCTKKSYRDNLYYVDDRGWVIKPISGGGDNNCTTAAFQYNSPPSKIICPPRRCAPRKRCARPESIVIFAAADKIKDLFKKAQCGCFKVLPSSMANALECSYKKAKCNSMKYCVTAPPICKRKKCKCPKRTRICGRAGNWVKTAYDDLENDSNNICRDMKNSIYRDTKKGIYPLKPTFKDGFNEVLYTICNLFKYVICTCCCCPCYFCCYCCHQCCRKCFCCLFC